MIDVERTAGDELRAVTVFTAMVGSFGDLTAQLLENVSHDWSGQQSGQLIGQGVALFQQINGLGLAQRNQVFLLHQARSLVLFSLSQFPLLLKAQEFSQTLCVFRRRS